MTKELKNVKPGPTFKPDPNIDYALPVETIQRLLSHRNSGKKLVTNALFVEQVNFKARVTPEFEPVFTLKEYDYTDTRGTYVSIYRVFMESETEHEAALRCFGDYAYWKQLCRKDWFLTGYKQRGGSYRGLEQWRKDKAEKDRDMAKKVLLDAAREGNVTAAKQIFLDPEGTNVKRDPVKKTVKGTRTKPYSAKKTKEEKALAHGEGVLLSLVGGDKK